MVKQRSRKAKTRKAVRRPARRKPKRAKVARKFGDSPKQSVAKNRKAQWDVFRDLQKKASRAWTKLRADVKRNASPEVLVQGRDHLLLLLGECNYLAGEYMRMGRRR